MTSGKLLFGKTASLYEYWKNLLAMHFMGTDKLSCSGSINSYQKMGDKLLFIHTKVGTMNQRPTFSTEFKLDAVSLVLDQGYIAASSLKAIQPTTAQT